MRSRWHTASSTVLLLTLLASTSSGLAQSGRTWVDPPGDAATAAPKPPDVQGQAIPEAPKPPEQPSSAAQTVRPQTPPASEAAQAPRAAPPAEAVEAAKPPEKPRETAQPRRQDDNRMASRDDEARKFVTGYLSSWSAPNDEALEATADLYADRVLFHGRNMSLGRLMGEKRRFVRRWPERQYRAQPDSLKVTCDPQGQFCTVHTVFDFTAENPRRRRRTEGVAALQVIVSFAEGQPVIVAENSMVLDQNRRRRNLALEGVSDD
jgi:hypothetical protein